MEFVDKEKNKGSLGGDWTGRAADYLQFAIGRDNQTSIVSLNKNRESLLAILIITRVTLHFTFNKL